MVQPHKKPGQITCPKPKERAIHTLVLLKAITAQDNPNPDNTEKPGLTEEEAKALRSLIIEDDPELFTIFPEECLAYAPVIDSAQLTGSIQRPTQLIGPMPQ